MQRITTNEPTDDIIEVGIAALKAALYGVEGSKAEVTETSDAEEEYIGFIPVDDVTEEKTVEEVIVEEEVAEKVTESTAEDNYKKAESIVDDLLSEILSDKND
jgi:hypothetical protein